MSFEKIKPGMTPDEILDIYFPDRVKASNQLKRGTTKRTLPDAEQDERTLPDAEQDEIDIDDLLAATTADLRAYLAETQRNKDTILAVLEHLKPGLDRTKAWRNYIRETLIGVSVAQAALMAEAGGVRWDYYIEAALTRAKK